jgi:hypothetical protein
MEAYVGYGFHVRDITPSQWLGLVKRFDKGLYDEIRGEARENNPNEVDITPAMEENVEEFIEAACSMGLGGYLVGIINDFEAPKGETILVTADGFVMFESLRFGNDEPRAQCVRDENGFIRMIGRYLGDTSKITFGNIYTGVEWMDPEYYMG